MPYPYRSLREWLDEEEKLGNVVRMKPPVKCGDYASIVDIGNGIPGKQPETEMRAVARYLHSLPGKPIGIIENPVNNRPDIPVIVNIWPTRERTIRGMGLRGKDELCDKIKEMKSRRVKPAAVPRSKAVCKQVVIPEAKIDLKKDISRCWVEFNQCLWSMCNATVILYDAKTGTHDLGKLRTGQFEWKAANPADPFPEDWVRRHMFATLIYLGHVQSSAGRYYYNNYRMKSKPMAAAFALGVPTDMHFVAALRGSVKWPETGDEYELVGGLRGEPVEVVESETIPGLMVPAQAEWVVEGEFLPEDVTMPPYAEDIASGYIFGGESCPVFKVKCITHQRKPTWTETTFSSSGLNGHEGVHNSLARLNGEVDALNLLRGLGFRVKDIVADAGREVVVVQMEIDGRDKPPHYGKQVAMAFRSVTGGYIGNACKYIIVVGPDIDPYDGGDVLWALGTRTMPVSDSIVIEKGLAQWGDPGGFRGPLGWKTYGEQVMIDALVKVPERYDEFPPRSEPVAWEIEAIRRIQKRLGK